MSPEAIELGEMLAPAAGVFVALLFVSWNGGTGTWPEIPDIEPREPRSTSPARPDKARSVSPDHTTDETKEN